MQLSSSTSVCAALLHQIMQIHSIIQRLLVLHILKAFVPRRQRKRHKQHFALHYLNKFVVFLGWKHLAGQLWAAGCRLSRLKSSLLVFLPTLCINPWAPYTSKQAAVHSAGCKASRGAERVGICIVAEFPRFSESRRSWHRCANTQPPLMWPSSAMRCQTRSTPHEPSA